MLSGEDKRKYMQLAIDQAKEAEKQGEVPIGAVVVDPDGRVVGTGYNRRELDEDATQHAEMIAIKEACSKLGMWRLIDCSLFVTLEPCPMCAGAIINAHIPKVYFGAYDFKNGSCGTVTNLFEMPYNFKPECVGGIMADECSALLKDFFKKLR